MLIAESGLNPEAARYGNWPDVSFGLSQITVATAAGYGIGDGTRSGENIAHVQARLFDRVASIAVGSQHLALCWHQARAYEDRELQALICYNSGSPQPEGNWYWHHYPGNVANYRRALEKAAQMLGG